MARWGVALIAGPVALSLAYAYRGGRLGQSSTVVGRLVWSAACAALTAALLALWPYAAGPSAGFWGIAYATLQSPLWGALLAGAGAYAGQLLSHGRYFGIGREVPNRNDWLAGILPAVYAPLGAGFWTNARRDLLAMAFIGWARGMLLVWYCPRAYLAALAAGPLHAASYWVAWRITEENAIALAEYIFGALLGVSIGASFLVTG
ncbi:MAG: hypothetical protein AB7H77_12000 [Bdellovibrionales bacterium]